MAEDNGNQSRQELKRERARLYKLFLKNPTETQLAVEIKAIDNELIGRSEQAMRPKDRSK